MSLVYIHFLCSANHSWPLSWWRWCRLCEPPGSEAARLKSQNCINTSSLQRPSLSLPELTHLASSIMPAKVSAKPTTKGDKEKMKTSTAADCSTEWGKPDCIIAGARARKRLETGHLKIFSVKDATSSTKKMNANAKQPTGTSKSEIRIMMSKMVTKEVDKMKEKKQQQTQP